MMNKKVETVLEFDKIKNKLKEYAFSLMAQEKISDISPSSDEKLVKRFQQETSEGVAVLKAE